MVVMEQQLMCNSKFFPANYWWIVFNFVLPGLQISAPPVSLFMAFFCWCV